MCNFLALYMLMVQNLMLVPPVCCLITVSMYTNPQLNSVYPPPWSTQIFRTLIGAIKDYYRTKSLGFPSKYRCALLNNGNINLMCG